MIKFPRKVSLVGTLNLTRRLFLSQRFVIVLSVTARSRSGLWLPTTEDRERTWRQSEISQILL